MKTIPFDVLADIDHAMVADRARAERRGPRAWEEALRQEAVRTMIAASGESEARVVRDLDAFLAGASEGVLATLEALVFEQRFLAAAAVSNTEEAGA